MSFSSAQLQWKGVAQSHCPNPFEPALFHSNVLRRMRVFGSVSSYASITARDMLMWVSLMGIPGSKNLKVAIEDNHLYRLRSNQPLEAMTATL